METRIFIKTIITVFIYPVSLFILICFWLIFHLFKNTVTKRIKLLFISFFIFFVLLTMNPTASIFINSLEDDFTSLIDTNEIKSAEYILILGGGYQVDHFNVMPENNQLDESSLARLIEGIRLKKINPKAKFIFSGSKPGISEHESVAKLYQKTYKIITYDTNNYILSELPHNTKSESIEAFKIAGKSKIILVTSASHMPRSVYLFKKSGCNVIAAPCHYSSKKLEYKFHFPNGNSITQTELAIHEYIGIWLYKLFD